MGGTTVRRYRESSLRVICSVNRIKFPSRFDEINPKRGQIFAGLVCDAFYNFQSKSDKSQLEKPCWLQTYNNSPALMGTWYDRVARNLYTE